MDASYVYQPIGQNSFRVLTILSVESEVSATLKEYSLLDPPEYYALSYAWTHEPLTASINCDGQILAITPDVLEALRCISTVNGCQSLWVDAICIDQADGHDEKAHQVSHMHQIYKKALEVYIWLGPWQHDSHLAMKDITSISDKFEDVDFDALHLRSDILDFADWSPARTKFHPLQLFFLINRPWFRRLWTYQEILLAKTATFFCGYEKKDLKSLLEFAKLMLETGFLHFFRKGDPHIPLGNLDQMRQARTEWQQLGTYNIPNEILKTRSRQVTEPLDRIYALLGLAEDTVYNSEISVDYSSTSDICIQELYIRFGKLVLCEENMLMLLYYNSSEERPKTLPSWCPDLNSPEATSGMCVEYAAGWPAENHQCTTSRHPAFKQLLGSYAEVSPSSDVVRVWGAQLDTVAQVGDVYPAPAAGGYADGGDDALLKEMLKWLDDNLELCKASSEKPDDAALYDSYWRTHVGNVGFNQKDFPCDSSVENSFSAFRRFVKGLALGQVTEDWPLASGLANHLDRIWRRRRFFITVGGRFGFGCADVVPGDTICALYSGPCLFALRRNPERETYTFKEAAYTHGLMQGEAFDLLDRGETTEELFAIE